MSEREVDLLSDLNESQRRAVTHADGPLLVLAGAGSGKTRVITRRVAYLIRQGAAPWQVLAITFTNKAAREMADRVAALEAPRGSTVCTFHSLCARLLREFAGECGLSPRYTIYDEADQRQLIKRAIEAAGLDEHAVNPAAALAAIGHAKMRLQTPQACADEAATSGQRLTARLYAAYEHALRAAEALDFDDLLLRMAFLLRDRPDVRRLLSERYRYVLIDEYQDTNHAQYIIAHAIALDHENICATGDPDQSIYSWRGADVANILEFERDYPNAAVIRLETNYRSTGSILAAADRLIGRNRRRKPKKLVTSRALGEAVSVVAVQDERAEAAEVARRVRSAVSGGRRHDEVAVFYRLNSLSRVLEDALRSSATPYRIARGVAFYSRKEVKDVLAYLRLLHNPLDDVACERIVNFPARGIGATTLGRLRAFAEREGLSLLEAAGAAERVPGLAKAARGRVVAFARMIGELREGIDAPVKEVLEAVLEATGMEQALLAAGGREGAELANVQELITSAAEFDRDNPDAGLSEYLNQVALVSDVDRFEGGTGAVTLMTLHAAKGLEFPVVIIVGCEEALLPFQRIDRQPPADLEEERRLCFVGMTRAADELVLTHARYRSLRGVRHRQTPSRFLSELDGERVRRIDLADEADTPAESDGPHPEGQEFYDATVDHEDGDPGYLAPGRRVRSPKFGEGRVVSVGRSGPHERAVVDFDRFGRKTLILQYARLERLS